MYQNKNGLFNVDCADEQSASSTFIILCEIKPKNNLTFSTISVLMPNFQCRYPTLIMQNPTSRSEERLLQAFSASPVGIIHAFIPIHRSAASGTLLFRFQNCLAHCVCTLAIPLALTPGHFLALSFRVLYFPCLIRRPTSAFVISTFVPFPTYDVRFRILVCRTSST